MIFLKSGYIILRVMDGWFFQNVDFGCLEKKVQCCSYYLEQE